MTRIALSSNFPEIVFSCNYYIAVRSKIQWFSLNLCWFSGEQLQQCHKPGILDEIIQSKGQILLLNEYFRKRKTGSEFLSAFLWGQEHLSVLVQLQNYRKRDRNEYKHSKKVWMNAGGSKAYHHRSNQLHHKGSSKEKRKSDLRRPLNLRSGEVTLSIAVGESIPKCTEG